MSRPKPILHVIEGSGAAPRDGARPPPRIRLIDPARDPRRPGGGRDAGEPGLRRGAEMSAALHLAVLALLLLLTLFQNVPQPKFTAIDVTYVQIGEGEGSEAPRPGVHAAQPEATPGAAPQAPELTAPPGTEEKPAAAGAPEQAAQAKSEEQPPPQPPKAEPPSATPTPQPQPAESKPQLAESAPQATETTPPQESEPQAAETTPKSPESAPSAAETPTEPPPVQSAELAPPKPEEVVPKEPEGILPPQGATTPETKPEESKPQPTESKPQVAETPPPMVEPKPKPKPPTPVQTAEVTPPKPAQEAPAPPSAPPPQAAPAPEQEVALATVPRPELPKLPSASKLRDEYARAEPTDLPPASKLIDAPRAGAARLPPRSEFKPGSPGDTRRAEAVGRAAGPPGEVGGTGDAIQSGGRPGKPGPGGGGGGGGDPIQLRISELQARIDRLLLVYGPDYPDVVALQRQIDQLYAKRGPLSSKELAEARRQLTECWAHASETLGMANKAIDLSLVLNRDGSVREAKFGDTDVHETVSPERLLDAIRACGPLSLPPERYLLWQRLNMRVGVS